jgi:hypothetical protein
MYVRLCVVASVINSASILKVMADYSKSAWDTDIIKFLWEWQAMNLGFVGFVFALSVGTALGMELLLLAGDLIAIGVLLGTRWSLRGADVVVRIAGVPYRRVPVNAIREIKHVDVLEWCVYSGTIHPLALRLAKRCFREQELRLLVVGSEKFAIAQSGMTGHGEWSRTVSSAINARRDGSLRGDTDDVSQAL